MTEENGEIIVRIFRILEQEGLITAEERIRVMKLLQRKSCPGSWQEWGMVYGILKGRSGGYGAAAGGNL